MLIKYTYHRYNIQNSIKFIYVIHHVKSNRKFGYSQFRLKIEISIRFQLKLKENFDNVVKTDQYCNKHLLLKIYFNMKYSFSIFQKFD